MQAVVDRMHDKSEYLILGNSLVFISVNLYQLIDNQLW